MIDFSCPHCGNRLRAPDARLGFTTHCPMCRRDVKMPAAGVAAPAPTEPPPAAEAPAKPSIAARLQKLPPFLVLIVLVLLVSIWIGRLARRNVTEFWDRLRQRPAAGL